MATVKHSDAIGKPAAAVRVRAEPAPGAPLALVPAAVIVSPAAPSPTPELDKLLQAEPDLVDDLFDYVLELLPEIAASEVAIKARLREQFGGERAYIRRPDKAARDAEIRLRFTGQNHSALARIYGLNPKTIYRIVA